jgi:cathepsin B
MHVLKSLAVILFVAFFVKANWVWDQVDAINKRNPGWTAGRNERFANVSLADAKKSLGLKATPVPVAEQRKRSIAAAQGLPESFDARTQWPDCILSIRDQGSCSSCYAFAATSMFAMRMCIQSGGAVKTEISPQLTVSCDTGNNGCDGGDLSPSWKYFQKSGTVKDSDYPYTSGRGSSGSCSVKSGLTRYYAANYTLLNSVSEMQTAIYTSGPIQVAFDIYTDFYNYKSGVYRKTTNSQDGSHSVYVVGWGTLNGSPYWLAINSWGLDWGMNGVFFIARGENMCNIETGYKPLVGFVAPSSIPSTAPVTTSTAAPTMTTQAPPTGAVATTTTNAPTMSTSTPTTQAPTTSSNAPSQAPITNAPSTKAPSTTRGPLGRSCPQGWVSRSSLCYRVSNQKLSWSAAKISCSSVGANLLIVSSAAENGFVLNSVGLNSRNVWLGLQAVSGNIVDTSGQTPSYTNMVSRSNSNQGCVSQIRGSRNAGKWQVESCSVQQSFVCVKNAQ